MSIHKMFSRSNRRLARSVSTYRQPMIEAMEGRVLLCGTIGDTPVTSSSPSPAVVSPATIDPPTVAPSIISATSTTFAVGTGGSFNFQTIATPTASITESGALPTGVTFVDRGTGKAHLSGTPAAGTGGSYVLNVVAKNTAKPNARQSFTLTVDQLPSITSAASVTFQTGVSSPFAITTSGFPVAQIVEKGTLPAGMRFTDKGDGTARITGTPQSGTAGDYPITLRAINGLTTNARQSFTIIVGIAPAITSGTTATTFFSGGIPYTFKVRTTGSPTPAITENGALPTGVTFHDNGNGTATISGTAARGTGGNYVLNITASNGIGAAATQVLDLPVTALF